MIIGLVGPTCVGKTSVSLRLAKSLDAEIISVDSRQIYRELTIGTAKPSKEELSAVPHHFVNERSLGEPITAAEFAEHARARIDNILGRRKRVLLVGGSTLYLHALLFGLDDIPPIDPEIRTELQARLDSEGLTALANQLAQVDPVTHRTIDLDNPRRILRALEVHESTGKPISSFRIGRVSRLEAKIFVLNRDRSDLYRRIDARVESMVSAGLVDEVKVLLDTNDDYRLPLSQTIGYSEVLKFIDSEIDEGSMVRLIQRNTRRYAKRQLTWFRRYEGFERIEITEAESVGSAASRTAAIIAEASPQGRASE